MNEYEPVGEAEAAPFATAESTTPTAPAEVVQEPEKAERPPDPVKADALMRLQRLEGRGKTVGYHLDEMRALLTILFRRLPD